jgi:hypothetical protein
MKRLRYDEIGYWSEVKLDIIKKYAAAYSKILREPHGRQLIYRMDRGHLEPRDGLLQD